MAYPKSRGAATTRTSANIPNRTAAPAGGERPEEERDRGGAEPRDRRPPPERPLDEALDPGRGQDREREHDHVAETPRVMEIHVAERDLEHERPEPARSDQERGREDVGREREPADGHDERTEPASASREEGARERHRARVGTRRRGEPERPRRPDAVGAERIADLGLAGFAERAVAAAQAGLAEEVHVRHEDRQRRDRQHDEEQRDASRRAPRGDRSVALDPLALDPSSDRAHDEVRGRERRRDHEPVTHVRRRHLRPRERARARATRAAPTIVRSAGTRRPRPAGRWSTRASPRTAARSRSSRSRSSSRARGRPPSPPRARATPSGGTRTTRGRRAAG